MKALFAAAREFARDEEGITAIEYGLLAAVVAGVIAVAFGVLGADIKRAFENVSAKLTAASGTTPATTP